MPAPSARLRGNTGLILKLKTGANAVRDFGGDVKNARLTSEDKDDSDLTFYEASSGDTKDFSLNVTAIQSTDATSLWRYLWDNPGALIDAVYAPHGNAAASATQPHFTFQVQADGKPEVGGEARRSAEGQDFEYVMKVVGPITLVTS